jgi:sirohydrochlorin ferrochelatase
MTGITLFAHGSSVQGANDAVQRIAASFAERGGYSLVEASFLELAQPDLPEAVKRLVARGADHILVIPYFLTLGIHLRRDLPRIVNELQSIYQGVRIEVTEPLDGHPALLEALLDRAKDAMNGGSGSESKTG